jgi:hypothetical protein
MVGGLDRHHGPAAEATLVMGWSLGVLSSMRENMKVAGGVLLWWCVPFWCGLLSRSVW